MNVTRPTKIQVLLLRKLTERPMSRTGRVPSFCTELEAEGYVRITSTSVSDLSIVITDSGRKALSDAERFANVANEYEAAQEHREAASPGRPVNVPSEKMLPTAPDPGLTRKTVFKAHQIHDTEKAPVGSLTLAHVNSSAYENEQGVHFPMMHNHTIVRILAIRAAIQGSGRAPADGRYLARFDAAREFFELLAREKFDPVRPLAKITITSEDLLGKARIVEGREF
jgi:hypothetical protein